MFKRQNVTMKKNSLSTKQEYVVSIYIFLCFNILQNYTNTRNCWINIFTNWRKSKMRQHWMWQKTRERNIFYIQRCDKVTPRIKTMIHKKSFPIFCFYTTFASQHQTRLRASADVNITVTTQVGMPYSYYDETIAA